MSPKQLLLSWWRRKACPASVRVRLRGEELESRDVLTTFLWDPFSAVDIFWWNGVVTGGRNPPNVIGATNWKELNAAGRWVRSSSFPGDTLNRLDDAIFDGSESTSGWGKECLIPGELTLELHSLNVRKNFTGTINLNGNTLRFKDRASLPGELVLNSPNILVKSGNITVQDSATFRWHCGGLDGVNIELASPTEGKRPKMIFRQRSGNEKGVYETPTLAATSIAVHGDLLWDSGNVSTRWSTGNPSLPNVIHVLSGGKFEIQADNATLVQSQADSCARGSRCSQP